MPAVQISVKVMSNSRLAPPPHPRPPGSSEIPDPPVRTAGKAGGLHSTQLSSCSYLILFDRDGMGLSPIFSFLKQRETRMHFSNMRTVSVPLPPGRWPLLRPVRILLECILVYLTLISVPERAVRILLECILVYLTLISVPERAVRILLECILVSD